VRGDAAAYPLRERRPDVAQRSGYVPIDRRQQWIAGKWRHGAV